MFEGIPQKTFRAIHIDPPWHYRTYSPKVKNPQSDRSAKRHYSVMSAEDLAQLPVRDLAHQDCHLFLWVTGPHLPRAFHLMSAWGFRYSATAFVWVKLKRAYDEKQFRLMTLVAGDLHVGLGLTTRKNAEFCLLARRGSPKRSALDVREIILSPVREHSRKPDEVYERIMRYCDGPYLDLFARESRPGWTTWGNEATKFDRTVI